MNAYELAEQAEGLAYEIPADWSSGEPKNVATDIADMLRQQADRITELEKLVSDMIYEKSSGVYDRPQTNSEPQKVTLYIYNNARDGKTWIDEHQNEMLYPEWKYMGKIEVLK